MKKVIFALLACLILPSVSNAFVGKIENIEGRVLYKEKPNTAYKIAKIGLAVNEGFWIKTESKSWVILNLSDGSKFTLSENTEFEVSKYNVGKSKKTGVFYVAQGKLRATITKLTGQTTKYTLKTPTAVAGIKGTEFMILTTNKANVFFGNEDTAYISGYNTLKKPLTPNTVVQNTRGLEPLDPINIEPNTPLEEAKKGLLAITAATPPNEWSVSGELANIIARWDINYGHYLADCGKYEEALYVFQIAIDLSDKIEIKADARLEKGAVYSRFLRNYQNALSEYLYILKEYQQTPQAETALFLAGMTLYDMGHKKQAKEKFLQYKNIYPQGKYITNIETFLRELNEE